MPKTFDYKAKSGFRPINLIIAALIMLPLIYLVVFSKGGKQIKIKAVDTTSTVAVDNKNTTLEAAIELCSAMPNENNYINLSVQYYNAAMYTECVEASKKALEYNPQSFYAYNNMCSAYNKLAKWELAWKAGTKAVALNPENDLAKNNLQVSISGKESIDKEILAAKDLAEKSKSENDFVSLGNLYYNTGLYVKAIESYRKALAVNDKNAVTYNNICSSYNELQQYQLAVSNCEKALELDSTNELAKNNLALARQRLK